MGLAVNAADLARLHIEPPVFKRLCPEKCRTYQTVRCRCRGTQDRSCRLANRSRLAWTRTCLYITMRNISFLPAASGNEPFRRLRCPRHRLACIHGRSRRFAISVAFALSSNRGCTPCCPRGRDRQRITAFVIRLAGVPSNVYPRHCVVADQLFELLPKVLVDNRLP